MAHVFSEQRLYAYGNLQSDASRILELRIEHNGELQWAHPGPSWRPLQRAMHNEVRRQYQ